MTRSIIAVLVAAVIVALTATAYFVTSSSQTDRVQRDLKDRVGRARNQLRQSATIEGLSVLRKIEALSTSPRLLEALVAVDPTAIDHDKAGWKPEWDKLNDSAKLGFAEFLANEKGDRPDVLALVDSKGDVVFMNGISLPTASEFKTADGKINLPALGQALERRIVISEIGRLPDLGLARIAAAPVIDHEASAIATAEAGKEQTVIRGAVIAAYAITAHAARDEDDLLGVRVAYFDRDHVSATSFTRGSDENTDMQERLHQVLDKTGLRAKALEKEAGDLTPIDVGGQHYLAATVKLPRFATKDLPKDYPTQDVGAMVLISVGDEAAAFVRPAKMFILLLGGGALAVAMFGMYLVHRRTESQIDEIELGVSEIINGNLDRTFRPVGSELDGLANGLNVMLARLLGRPEPGEEAFDENGNPIIPGRVDFEEAPEDGPAPAQGMASSADPDLAALAQEPEPDYYKRVFTEYGAARRETGSPDDVSFESFIAKLRVNEGKLKAQYNCRAVRFRVVVKDGKTTLKPVPIF
jgi:hypothetical protein